MARPAIAMAPGGAGASPAIARKTGDLPDPDSPTMPNVSPASTAKDTPCTAVTVPWAIRKTMVRFSTLIMGLSEPGDITLDDLERGSGMRQVGRRGEERL